MNNFEQHITRIVNDNGMVLLKVNDNDLEESINGLNCLLPILKQLVIKSNGNNRMQAILDAQELEKHFNTAITAMTMLLANVHSDDNSDDLE
jgi:hypothetical protein